MNIVASQKAFTLLEVMIAMAILALALTALMGHQAVSVQMSDYSNKLSQANLLAYGKLLDLEHMLIKDSMDVLDNCDDGDFRAEGLREFKWKACAYKLEIADGASEQIADQVMSGLSGAFGLNLGDSESMGQSALTQLGQVQTSIAAIPMFLQRLEDKIRKVRLEITWRDFVEDRVLIVERFVTSLGADGAGSAPPEDGKAEPVPETGLQVK
jgi:general secretion pathway protein I